MTIPTLRALHGFIAAEPQLTRTRDGIPRVYMRVGVEHFEKQPDGRPAKTASSFHDLVIYGRTAEHSVRRFAVGDNFVASGYLQHYEVKRNGSRELREEFVAKRIGHDVLRTSYVVAHQAAGRDLGSRTAAHRTPRDELGL